MGAGPLTAQLPAALRTRRDIVEGLDRWAAASVRATADEAAVLVMASAAGGLLWAVGDVDQLERLVPDVLVGHGPGLRWATVPRAVRLPDDALASAGIERRTSWDRFTTDAAPAAQPGQDTVVALDPVREADAIGACLELANPGTHARPGAAADETWWGVRDGDGVVGVLAAATRPGPTAPTVHLHGLGVVPAARGRGLGAALAAAATRHALSAGAPWVSLSMYADNVHARRVYDALGFRVDVENVGYGPPGATRP